MADILTIAERAKPNRRIKIKAITFVVLSLTAAGIVALDLFVWRVAA